MRLSLAGQVGSELAPRVADVGAAISSGVGVENFLVVTGVGDTETIAFADNGRAIDDGNDEVIRRFPAADERKNAVVCVVGVDPFKTLPVEIDLMKCRLGSVKLVEVSDKLLDAAMRIVLKKMPVNAACFGPFAALGDLLTHEKEFFAGMGVLIRKEETEICKLLPHIARHFMEE